MNKPPLIIKNKFNQEVRYKPFQDCTVKDSKNVEYPVAAEGINTGIKPGKVFKLRSGTNVYIDKNGNVRSYSPISAWVNKWVSRKKLTPFELNCGGWEKLF